MFNLFSFSKMKFALFCLIPVFFLQSVSAQTALEWTDFTNISFVTAPSPTEGYSYMKPIFQDRLMELDGKEVQVTGYVIPLDVEGYQYVISAYPNSSCFFCGGAVKESVVVLFLISY